MRLPRRRRRSLVSPDPWTADVPTWLARAAEHGGWTWPGPLPDLSVLPVLYIRVTTPRDQGLLHHELTRLGYIAELMASDDEADYWRFEHPDGERA